MPNPIKLFRFCDNSCNKCFIARIVTEPLFISYARKEEEYKNELTSHLSGLRNSGLIDDWSDFEILPGQ